MKKNVLIKSILVLVAIAIFALVFVGCISFPTPPVVPTTGTVIISIANDNYWYDIYIDGSFWGQTNWSGDLTLYNVPIGYHFFQAYDISGWLYGSLYQTINAGTNYVTFWVW